MASHGFRAPISLSCSIAGLSVPLTSPGGARLFMRTHGAAAGGAISGGGGGGGGGGPLSPATHHHGLAAHAHLPPVPAQPPAPSAAAAVSAAVGAGPGAGLGAGAAAAAGFGLPPMQQWGVSFDAGRMLRAGSVHLHDTNCCEQVLALATLRPPLPWLRYQASVRGRVPASSPCGDGGVLFQAVRQLATVRGPMQAAATAATSTQQIDPIKADTLSQVRPQLIRDVGGG